jgi:hypothetical protein
MLSLCRERASGKIAIFQTNRAFALRTICAIESSRAQIARRKYLMGLDCPPGFRRVWQSQMKIFAPAPDQQLKGFR